MSRFTEIMVCAVGSCTAVGGSAAESAASVRAGISGYAEHPFMVDRYGERMVVARAPYLDPNIPVGSRIITLMRAAASETTSYLKHTGLFPYRMHVIIGLPDPRPGLPQNLADSVYRLFQDELEFPCDHSVQTCSAGHSAGVIALKAGMHLIEAGEAEVCLVGGGDSYLEPDTLEWLDANEQLRSRDSAWGFVPGEAAAFCILTSPAIANRIGAHGFGTLMATAEGYEPNRIKTDTVCLGRGLTEAVKQVLEVLPTENKVHRTICDLNGESYRADEFGFTLARTSERFVDATDVQSPADCWGDVGAASGPLFVNLWATGKLKSYAPEPWTLIWTSSENGRRAAALLG